MVGRPWWYDDYWEKDKRATRKRSWIPGRKAWIWIAIVALSLLLAVSSTGFRPVITLWIIGFISHFCRILLFAVIIRAVLSWFTINHTNIMLVLLNDITDPILYPLRRVIPMVGMFDISPIVAAFILYLIPLVLNILI
ncbi:MAG TPA: hypothetical protein DCX22_04010 [Dehalococcoidia bacterium]|nr:hypothetical protein [Dehalococcoidia bacterium]